MSMGRAGHNPLLSFPVQWIVSGNLQCTMCSGNLHNVQWRDIVEVLKVVVSPVQQLAQSESTLSTILQPGDLPP